MICFILGLLFLLPVALGVYGLTKGRKNAVRIHENGVVVHKAGVDVEVLFDAVDTYSDGGFLVITTRDDDSIQAGLIGLANANDLFRRLREEVVVKRRAPEVLKALAAGEVAEFGAEAAAYALDENGITVAASDRRIAWSEILEFGSTSKSVPGPGRTERAEVSVFLKTNADTVEAAIDPLSQRELLLALCNAMKARPARPTSRAS